MRFGFAIRQMQDVRTVRLRRSPSVTAARSGDGIALLDARSERYFTLNEVGGHVWALLATPTTFAQIVESIRKEFDVPPAAGEDLVERDIAALLRDLRAAGLVTEDGPLLELR